jgi:hypothetical protein
MQIPAFQVISLLLSIFTSKTVDVFGYSKELHSMDGIPIATVGSVWTWPTTGDNYLLVINQCVFFGPRLKHSLICPNQLQAHGIVVHDTPTQFNPTSKHAIIHHDLTISLDMLGFVSYFESRSPKSSEIDTLQQIVLTSDTDWATFSESAPSSHIRHPIYVSSLSTQVSHGPIISSIYRNTSMPEIFDDHDLSACIDACVRVSSTYNAYCKESCFEPSSGEGVNVSAVLTT